jgi:hypothetical protein
LTLAPGTYVDAIETLEAGWLLRRLTHWSAWINARLAKRYAVPFAASPLTPETVTGWLEAIVTWEVYLKRGADPTDAQLVDIKKRYDDALADVNDAANNEQSRPELPLRNDTNAQGITRGGPLAYVEVSPYTWSQVQRDAAEDEPQ